MDRWLFSGRTKLVISGLLLFTGLLGCGRAGNYLRFWDRQREAKRTFQDEASATLLKELHPEDCFLLLGRVTLSKEYDKPLLVVAVTDQYRKRELAAQRVLQVPLEYYQAYLPEGQYDLYFFADLNQNGTFDTNEMIGGTSGAPIAVKQADAKDGLTIQGPAFDLDISAPSKSDLAVNVPVSEAGFVHQSLGSEFFDAKYGTMGLYDPKAFMAHTQRYMFTLAPNEPAETTVLFVHGVGGTPRDFKYLVEKLDRTRYQPWFYFYPSGMPLQKLSSLLADIIKAGAENKSYGIERLVVVAHSMGGLVALSGLNQLCAEGVPSYLKGYVSFNSPYGGVEAAKAGVENAPVVIPSWRDVMTGSDFLEDLYEGGAGQEIPFYLFFGFETGESSDGTITLQSQLDPRVHFMAYKSYGFNATHVGILNDEAARKKFYEVIERFEE